MPVTRSRNGIHEMLALDQTNTARFLFGEDEPVTSPEIKGYHFAMDATDDNFPILVRQNEHPSGVSYSNSVQRLGIHKANAVCSCPLRPLLSIWQTRTSVNRARMAGQRLLRVIAPPARSRVSRQTQRCREPPLPSWQNRPSTRVRHTDSLWI